MGKAALDQAIASPAVAGKYDVEVRWHPFFLRPGRIDDPSCRDGIPPGTNGAPSGPYWHGIAPRARELGIDMSGGVDRFPYVLYSHSLLDWAEREHGWAAQHRLAELIFKAYYSDNVYLGIDNLALLAGEVGLPQDAALAHLRSGAGEEEVKRQARHWSQSGVSGVPYFFVNRRPAFSGARDPASFARAITAAAAAP